MPRRQESKNTGEKLRKQLSTLIYLNRKIIPTYILEQRKEYRESIRKRNTYAEVLNILQADIMKKLYKNKLKIKNKKLLTDCNASYNCWNSSSNEKRWLNLKN